MLGDRDGSGDEWEGQIDEAVIFKDIITDAESQSICGGTYP